MAGGPQEIVIQDSNPLYQWFKLIVNMKGETENNQPQALKIPKVPYVLRKNRYNQEYYIPLVVSIGPYHKDRAELGEMQRLKLTMVCQFVKDSGKSIEELYIKVREFYNSGGQKARKCYAPDSIANLEDEEFIQMMFADSCFILQFIFTLMRNPENLKMSNQEVAYVRRDLLLLENQLPYEILKSLMSLRFENGKNKEGEEMIKDFIKIREPWKPIPSMFIPRVQEIVTTCVCAPIVILLCCCCMCFAYFFPRIFTRWCCSGFSWSSAPKKEEEKEDHAHLLELLYAQLINKNTKLDDVSKNHGPYLYYSAKDLKKVGIYFKPSRTSALTDVQFKPKLLSGILELPPITVDESTRAMLLNLVAYETCTYESNKHWVTAYICFMDSLINDAEDVMELRSNGIICNFLGTDELVAKLFNEMASDLVPNPLAYIEVKRNINLQCHSTIKKWVAEFLQVYFRSPWTFIAVVGASFAIILTVIQTYMAIWPPK